MDLVYVRACWAHPLQDPPPTSSTQFGLRAFAHNTDNKTLPPYLPTLPGHHRQKSARKKTSKKSGLFSRDVECVFAHWNSSQRQVLFNFVGPRCIVGLPLLSGVFCSLIWETGGVPAELDLRPVPCHSKRLVLFINGLREHLWRVFTSVPLCTFRYCRESSASPLVYDEARAPLWILKVAFSTSRVPPSVVEREEAKNLS